MDFSVVIPTYNRAAILRRTLEALARQRPWTASGHSTPAFEVIVVDDGSSDPTRETVATLAEAYPAPLLYLHQQNRKQGAARNLGASRARGEWLVFLGDDTVPDDDFLLRHHESHRRRDFLTAVIGYTPWADEYPKTRFMEYIGERGWQFGFALIDDPEDVPFNFFYTSNLSLSRRLFASSGGFDEAFKEYGWEDIELSLRLRREGMRIVYNPLAVARHHHPTSMRSFLARQKKVGFSAWTFYRKHPEMKDFLGIGATPPGNPAKRLKMALLTRLCCWTERLAWPDLSRYYPDVLSYHYRLGLADARK